MLHRDKFSDGGPGFSGAILQRRKMNLKLLGAHLKPMQLVDQREPRLTDR
jgi:hypothetical protein